MWQGTLDPFAMCRVDNSAGLESAKGEAGVSGYARLHKWLEKTEKQPQQRRMEKTTTKHVKGVKEQHGDKNSIAKDEEVDFVHHPLHDHLDRAREEQHSRKEFRGSPQQSKDKTTETGDHQREGNRTTKISQGRRRSSKRNNGGHRITGYKREPRG